ncbi:serine protease [Deinococcus metalli]|uniref:Serine protease n=1 Tax=Deinococcus metalli TaxID=1141878 RepID=A0A7W8NU18_9DEIO|nr:S8 family serine peptidase [Deinococcus metalli]MBB5378847.1 serine protease [Deinococcus metalli]GHF62141.1 serine protease [Deinococcus metalli]
MDPLSPTRRRLPRALLLAGVLLGTALPAATHAIKLVPIPALPPALAAPARPEIAPVAPTPATPELQPVSPTPATTSAPSVPSDPLYARQWPLPVIRLPQAWEKAPGGPVTVAVLDTGYVASPELAGRVVNGYDFVSDPARSGDGDGRDADATGLGPFAYHAEVVANVIAAGRDGQGMVGVNPQAKIVHVRVAGTDGMIAPQDLVDAMKWAVGLSVPGVPANPNPARLLNLSLYADFIPLTGCDARIQAAIDTVTARGALVVAGAANDGTDARGYSPAGCRNVVTVTSVSAQGARPDYANWGSTVTLAAPGGERGHGIVASSVSGPGGERTPNGTSFAAPHVTGVASLLLSVRPKLSPALLRSYLTRSATPFPNRQCDPVPTHTCGSGTLNAEAAVKLALASSVGK